MQFTAAELTAWTGSWLWPFLRIGSMLIAAPLFGARTVSTRVRVMFAFLLAMIIAPLLPQPPAVEPLSAAALMIAMQQILIGLVIGFVLQMAFSAITQAGEYIALSTGLGFASMIDPAQGVQVPVVSQFFVIMATLVFLGLDGHLALIELTLDSFRVLPVGESGIEWSDLWVLVIWGGRMFAGALLIALPAVVAMLLVNASLGVIVRAAPQLNIFAVGFPLMILLGMVVIILSLPGIVQLFTEVVSESFELVVRLLGA